MLDDLYAVLFYDVSDIVSEAPPELNIENLSDFTLPDQSIAHRFVIRQLQSEPASDFLEGMAERAMPEIMNQCGGQSFVFFARLLFSNMVMDYRHQLARGMEDANTVGEARMARPWVDKIGKAELLYPAQALEWPSLHNFPQGAFELRRRKLDQIMQRIANALAGHLAYQFE